jgi:DNA (cytosine-5)-methyltransferase 1
MNVASMFAGIGGICSGFKQAGCEIVWANEVNAAACRTYRHNFGSDYLIESDIRDVPAQSIPDFDILTAGFPCQSFSIGGKQKGFDDNRGVLFFEVARIIDTCRPPIIFLENVENLIEHDGGKTFLVIYNVLAQYGYSVRYKVMPSYEYGNVPQPRKRIYIMAFSSFEQCDLFAFPEPLSLERRIDDIVNPTERKKDIYYYKNGTDVYKLLDSFIGNKSGLFRIYRGQIRNVKNPELCPTLTASMCDERNAVVLRDDYGIRRLTLREVLDFQGFPAEYFFPKTIITLADAYRQVGNSVSVPVVRRIAEQIKTLFE